MARCPSLKLEVTANISSYPNFQFFGLEGRNVNESNSLSHLSGTDRPLVLDPPELGIMGVGNGVSGPGGDGGGFNGDKKETLDFDFSVSFVLLVVQWAICCVGVLGNCIVLNIYHR